MHVLFTHVTHYFIKFRKQRRRHAFSKYKKMLTFVLVGTVLQSRWWGGSCSHLLNNKCVILDKICVKIGIKHLTLRKYLVMES